MNRYFLLNALVMLILVVTGYSVWADDKLVDKPKPKPQFFCEPQLQLAETHLGKVTKDLNSALLRDTAHELQIQALQRQIMDLKKKLDDVQKAAEAQKVAPDVTPGEAK